MTDPYKSTSFISKVDKETNTEKRAVDDSHLIPSECIFVPRPENAGGDPNDEEDGVAMTVVVDTANETSHLLILDGKSFDPIAKVETPIVCNFGLHTIFVPSEKEFAHSRNKF